MITKARYKIWRPTVTTVFVLLASAGAVGTSRQVAPHFRVLLIGIGAYGKDQMVGAKNADGRLLAFPDLSGDRDMAKLKALLTTKYPAAEIDDSLCKPGAATKANIQAAFNSLGAKCQPGDAVYIAFSGHGTQVPESSKSTGVAQAFVPYDVKVAGDDDPAGKYKMGDVFKESVISGPEFNVMIQKISNHVKDASGLANITLSFDCCHSGSITRGATDGWVQRGYQNPAVKDLAGSDGSKGAAKVADEPAIKGLICLSAAQASQKAYERPGQGGLFTTALLESLGSLDPNNGAHSYQTLFREIRTKMALPQTPEPQQPDLLGEQGRAIFSSKTLPLADGYPIATPPDPNGKPQVKMLAGAAFGIHKGDKIGIFKPGTEDPSTKPLATGLVSNPGPTSSFITLDGPARTDAELQALSGNDAILLKAAPAGQLRVQFNGPVSPELGRLIDAQPDITRVGPGEQPYAVVDAPSATAPSGPAAAWSINVAGSPPLTLAADEFEARIIDDLRQVNRFRAVQAFEKETKLPEVVVEMRLVPIKTDASEVFVALSGGDTTALPADVNSKARFLIQVRAYSLEGTKQVKGKFNPCVAILNGNPNWTMNELWPGNGSDSPASTVGAEEHRLTADGKWWTLKRGSGFAADLSDTKQLAPFQVDATQDGVGAEFFEVVATPDSVDYTPFFTWTAAQGSQPSTSRGAASASPNKWSAAIVTVHVIKG